MMFPMDADAIKAICIEVMPKEDFNSKEQKLSADGVPLWIVKTVLPGHDYEKIKVTVPAPTKPVGLEHKDVLFSGLTLMTWENAGRSGVAFFADSVALHNSDFENDLLAG